jgi:DNA-directed RNA polymerase subunit RPC12/RpoP
LGIQQKWSGQSRSKNNKMTGTMQWENLRQFRCPYCGHDLQKGKDAIKCTRCHFSIEQERFKSIAENRRQNPTNQIKIKWQNLIEARCPICGNMLKPNEESKVFFQKCISYDCTFKISDSRIGEILNDPKHAANIFYQQTN